MTEEQLIQEYGDAVYPRIAKALINETRDMVIEEACKWLEWNASIMSKKVQGVTEFHVASDKQYPSMEAFLNEFRQSLKK